MGDLMPHIADNFWVERLAMKLNNFATPNQDYGSDDIVIIPDVRFQNEFDWILENNGIIIHLTRPGASGNVGIPGHLSESELSTTPDERIYILTNDQTLDYLKRSVINIVIDSGLLFPDTFI